MKIIYNGKTLENIVQELKQRNIPFEVSLEEECIVVEGFSKSGNAYLSEDENGIVTATTRYNQQDTIDSFEDLVGLNFEWFTTYKDSFKKPDPAWADTLVEFGFLKKKTTTVTNYY